MQRKIADDVYWVGVRERFDPAAFDAVGDVDYGGDRDAYILMDDRIALINVVNGSRTAEFLRNIRDVIDPSRICLVVANRMDADHPAGVPAVLDVCREAKLVVLANAMGERTRSHKIGRDAVIVHTGDRIVTGKYELAFVEGPMNSFPDRLFTAIRKRG